MIGVDVLLDGAAVVLFGIAMVLLELVDVEATGGTSADTTGLDVAAGIVNI